MPYSFRKIIKGAVEQFTSALKQAPCKLLLNIKFTKKRGLFRDPFQNQNKIMFDLEKLRQTSISTLFTGC